MRPVAIAAFSLGLLFSVASFAAPRTLKGKWSIVSVSGAAVIDQTKTRAEFAANGRFASTIGCNRIGGKPTISGAKISFGPMMATRMACPPPFDALERQYLDALQQVASYRLAGDRLTFLSGSGEELVGLERME